MKKQLIVTSILLSLAMNSAMAASTHQETENTDKSGKSDSANEIIGMTTGAVIGGLIAGPIGLVAAGTIGLFIGYTHDQNEELAQVETNLAQKKRTIQSLSHDKQTLEERLINHEKNQQQLTDQLALSENTLSQGDALAQLKLNLRFDIDSTQVESFYTPQIKHLAMMMQENPELSVNLSGFTDASGSDESNLILSQARIESVKLMLVSHGVDEKYILTEAFGESHSMQAKRTESSDFNDRRVDVELLTEVQIQASKMEQDKVGQDKVAAQAQGLTPEQDVSSVVEAENVHAISIVEEAVQETVEEVAQEQVLPQEEVVTQVELFGEESIVADVN